MVLPSLTPPLLPNLDAFRPDNRLVPAQPPTSYEYQVNTEKKCWLILATEEMSNVLGHVSYPLQIGFQKEKPDFCAGMNILFCLNIKDAV